METYKRMTDDALYSVYKPTLSLFDVLVCIPILYILPYPLTVQACD